MGVLSIKNEAFCVAYVEHGDATKAYRDAGYAPNAKPETVRKLALLMLKREPVMKRLAELRQSAGTSSNITLETHLAELCWLREQAAASGKYSAAVQAEMARGKVVGLYIDRVAVSGSLDVTEKPDLSKLTEEDLQALALMHAKLGTQGHTLQ